MMWTTCFRAKLPAGEIESTIATGPSTVGARRRGRPPLRARGAAPRQALTRVDAAAGQQPVLAPALLVAAEEQPVLPAQDGRDADARLGAASAPEEPKPRDAALGLAAARRPRPARPGDGDDDELGDPHARLDDERLARSVLSRTTLHLAAVARVDQPGRVDDRDAVPRGEPGARQHAAPRGPRGSRPRDPSRRRPARPAPARAARRRRGRGRRRPRRHASGRTRVRVEPPQRQLGHAADADSRRAPRPGTARSGAGRGAASRARTRTPSSRSLRSSIGAPSA